MALSEPSQTPSKFVVFEGVDGVGKSTLAELLLRYYQREFLGTPVAAGSFPGARAGSLGEWVYRLHHGKTEGVISAPITPPALQLLHVAAHVDAISSWIAPALEQGCVILDRYWWSTYAYARIHLSRDDAWALVAAEHPFWSTLARPIIFYITRTVSLKGEEVDRQTHIRLDRHYREVMERDSSAGVEVHELANNGKLEDSWRQLLAALTLPYAPV